MKQERKRNFYHKHSWIVVLSALIVAITIGGSFYFLKGKDIIFAKHGATVLVDELTPDELKVPENSYGLFEEYLINLAGDPYKDYQQAKTTANVLERENIEAWSDEFRYLNIIGVQRLVDDTYLLAIRATREEKQLRGAIIFANVDSEGHILNYSYQNAKLGGQYDRLTDMLYPNSDGKYISFGFQLDDIGETYFEKNFYFYEIDPATTNVTLEKDKANTFVKEMKTPHEVRFFEKDPFGTGGTDQLNAVGFISGEHGDSDGKGLIPVGDFDLLTLTGTFSHYLQAVKRHDMMTLYPGLNYANVTQKEIWHIIPMAYHELPNGDYFTIINYYVYFATRGTQKVSTMQIFKSDGSLKKVEYFGITETFGTGFDEGQLITVNGNNVYYFVEEDDGSYIHEYNYVTGNDKRIQTFPKDTSLYFEIPADNSSRLSFYGYASELSDAFSGFYSGLNGKYLVFGTMENPASSNPFEVVTLTPMEVNEKVVIEYVDKFDAEHYFIAGTQKATNFSNTPSNDPNHTEKPTSNGGFGEFLTAFFGSVKFEEDYAPIIQAKEDANHFVDISDPKINSTTTDVNNLTWMERMLIIGEDSTDYTKANAVKVYDVRDMQDSLLGSTEQARQEYLNRRINRNINNPTNDIDWLALGFDKTLAGPQEVSYFIGDVQRQITTTSRFVNKTTDQSIIDDAYILDAQNFHVPLSSSGIGGTPDVNTSIPDKRTFKKMCRSTAWNYLTYDIDEIAPLNQFDDVKVTINDTQFKALQNATVAKPYPVDVTYTPKSGISLTNRVWVFVTTKNTVVDESNRVVFYGDDYTLPLYLAGSEQMSDVYTKGNIKIYDYHDNSHETDPDCDLIDGKIELPTIAGRHWNSTTQDYDLITTDTTITNMTVINDATEACVVQPKTDYTWPATGPFPGTTTTGTIDVTITASALFHVRQVVYSDKNTDFDEIVIPSEGYLQLTDAGTKQHNITVPSGAETTTIDNPAFKDVVVELEKIGGKYQLDFNVIVPEYYTYTGYVKTDTKTLHQSSGQTTGNYKFDLALKEYEQWITVYVKPNFGNDDLPKPYSWDYETNEIGEIKP